MKKIVFPVLGVCALSAGLFAFNTSSHENDDDKKCTVKIIKNVNGVETMIDSTFDCSDSLVWQSLMGGENMEVVIENIEGGEHDEIKVMMIGGEEHEGDLSEIMKTIKIDCDAKDVKEGVRIMKFIGEDGKVTELKDGDHNVWVTEDEDVMINIDDNGEKNEVKIIKKKDENGNVTIQKWVNGEEVEPTEEDMDRKHKKHVMMFESKGGNEFVFKGDGDMKSIEMDVNVEVVSDGETKHIIIIKNITTSNIEEIEKEMPEAAAKVSKEELNVENLRFGPNPSSGQFGLSFNMKESSPVQIRIYDIQGKEVFNENVKQFNGAYNNNIDISENGKGTYVLQIMQGNKTKTRKVVVK